METIGELQDALDVEITTYLKRAQAVNAQHGSVSITECLTADDVATLKQAGAILIFAATMLVSWGAPQEQVEGMSDAAGVALRMVRDMTNKEG